jgi:hypothetical protein
VNKGPKIICRKSASKMDTDFALVVCIANFTNYLLEGVVALNEIVRKISGVKVLFCDIEPPFCV